MSLLIGDNGRSGRGGVIRLAGALIWGALFSITSVMAEPVVLRAVDTAFEIDAKTLAIYGHAPDGTRVEITGPGLSDMRVTQMSQEARSASWELTGVSGSYGVMFRLDGDDLVASFSAEEPGTFAWPSAPRENSWYAYALPLFNEGRYIETGDAFWQDFLTQRYSRMGYHEASLPIATMLTQGASLTVIHETPLDVTLRFRGDGDRLVLDWDHEFTQFNQAEPYVVRFSFGPEDPVAGARRFRQMLEASQEFRTLDEKVADNPEVRKLAGAAHIYFHGTGPLKAGDILSPKKFLSKLYARKDDAGMLSHALWQHLSDEDREALAAAGKRLSVPGGYVDRYETGVIVRMLNEQLPVVVKRRAVSPLPGGHDPAAQAGWLSDVEEALEAEYPGLVADRAEWGSGLSVEAIEALRDAGIDRAWLGTADWLEILWHPDAAQAALDAGYLLGPYDSYASAHPEDLTDTWNTAQQGDEIFETAGYVRADGERVTGFAGRGVYVNPLLVRDYARQRMTAVTEAATLNSYFIDVDATGLSYNDYSLKHPTGRAAVIEELRSRIGFIANDLGLVSASENGTYLFARDLAVGHGIMTPPYAWMDRRMRDRGSDYFRGGYWPPQVPDIMFKPTPIPDELARAMYAPQDRLPLFQVALHDAMVTTHHWEYGSLKPVGLRDRVGLLQLLYMMAPLYHASLETMDRDLPAMATYQEIFAPLHERLWNVQMTGFSWLGDDRLVQRTDFADGTSLTVNFAGEPRRLAGGKEIPVRSVLVEKDGRIEVYTMPSLD